MSTADLVTALNRADLTVLPDVHRLDERGQVFWTLDAVKRGNGPGHLTSAQISDLLRDGCGIALPRQRVAALLAKENGTVAKRKIGGKLHFALMKIGEDWLVSSGIDPIFIVPTKALSSIRKVEEIFGGLIGDIRICDPHVDNRTLDFMTQFSCARSIKFLTENIHKESLFKRDLKAFTKEHGSIRLSVRIFGYGELHDRYVIHDDGMLLIGTSLNSLGFKQSLVVALGEDLRSSVLMTFDKTWNRATPYTAS